MLSDSPRIVVVLKLETDDPSIFIAEILDNGLGRMEPETLTNVLQCVGECSHTVCKSSEPCLCVVEGGVLDWGYPGLVSNSDQTANMLAKSKKNSIRNCSSENGTLPETVTARGVLESDCQKSVHVSIKFDYWSSSILGFSVEAELCRESCNLKLFHQMES